MSGTLFELGDLLTGSRERHVATIRELCQIAYLGDEQALCRVLGRYKMFVDTADIGLSGCLMLDGIWQMPMTEAMLRHVPLGAVALDVGAHCGYFSTLLGELVGPDGRVMSFEPNRPMARMLRRSMAINGFGDQSEVHEIALGDSDRPVLLSIPAGDSKNARVVAPEVDMGATSVLQRRLDAIPGAVEADFVKIDVEGGEDAVWRGMTGIFDRGHPFTIFMRFLPARYADPAAFIDDIVARGFALNLITADEGVVPTTRDALLSDVPDRALALIRK